jgi:amino acid adenylation domain-containing protein
LGVSQPWLPIRNTLDFHAEADILTDFAFRRDHLSAAENDISPVYPAVNLAPTHSRETVAPSVPDLLRASFSAMPSHPAAEFAGTIQTRAELAEQSDKLASWLIENGVGCGSLVGIYMDRSIEMLVSVIAVLKAGGAYVPVDPTFPRIRVEQILAEAQPPVLLTLTRHRADLQGLQGRVFCVDGEADALLAQPISSLPKVHSDMRAYVIFTSGSTGTPKGVEVTHGSIVNLLKSVEKLVEFGRRDRLFAITTLAFDISVLELLLPLVCGGTVIIAGQDVAADGRRLARELTSTRATMLQATPVTFRELIEVGFKPPSGFKMLCGGEAWTMAMAGKLLATGSRLWNMYGPTETTVWSSVVEVTPGDTKLTISPSIANTRFYVVDEKLNPLPFGERGELLIGGSGVAHGYFNRKDLTVEKFLPDFKFPGEKMYRTGDEVRQLAEDRFEFIGRLDQQIKLRGYRIELGEIETAMAACDGVRDAVVMLRKEASGEAFLVGFYIAADSVSAALLRESLTQRLPGYMVPRYFERLESFPLTPNGKTDRLCLADYPLTANSLGTSSDEGPESQTEHEIASMWQKLFPGMPIGADSDFFEFGGDSLLMVRLQSMINRAFGLQLNAIDITTYSTMRKLAQWVDGKQADDGSDETPPPDPRLLPLQSSGDGPPIFVIPQMMVFRSLAQELGTEQPVYGVQLMEEDVPESIDSANMEALANLYVGLIRRVQPRGPYRLGGWCMWGWMAYEIARLLEEQGEVVEILIIIDALAPGFWDRYSKGRQILMSGIVLAHRMNRFANRLWRSTRARRDKEGLRLLRTLILSVTSALPRRFRPEAYVIETSRLEQITASAASSYWPAPIKANVLVFKSEVRPSGLFMGQDMGWNLVLGRPLQVDTLPGNHLEIFHPRAARIMAGRIRDALGLRPEAISQS